jgi:hypothetical protein
VTIFSGSVSKLREQMVGAQIESVGEEGAEENSWN